MNIKAIPFRTPACDKHLERNEDEKCPWCELEAAEKALRDLWKFYHDSAPVGYFRFVHKHPEHREIIERVVDHDSKE